ncbi:MAG: hypothetical protein R6W88_18040 [Desulfobacterales bacterium]
MNTSNFKLKDELTLLEKVLIIFASSAVCFLAGLLLVSTILFALKIPINIYNLPVSFILSIIFIVWLSRKVKADFFILLVGILLMLILFLISLLISFSVFDLSYDGQAYHQEAVILLDRGWNPVYVRLTNQATANLERWLNHYPKGNWIIAANIYKVTGNIESAKMMSIFSGFVAFAFVFFGLYRHRISISLKILLSTLFVLNPVYIYQSLSFYIDGFLVSFLLALAFISLRIIKQKEEFLFWPFLFVAIILINIKLSAVIFFAALTSIFFIYLWVIDELRFSISFAKITLVSSLIGVLFLGFNPFVTNYSTKGHPLYPAMGKDAYNFVENNTPENYWALKPPVRLLASIFSKSSLARGKGQFGELKLPIKIYSNELESFRETNTKIGGFGPLFGLTFILSIFGFIFYLFTNLTAKKRIISILLIFSTLTFAAIIPTSSVARYVPFVWWIPCLVVCFLFINKGILYKIAGSLIAVTLIINSVIVGVSYYPYNLEQSKKLDRQLYDLSQNIVSPIYINVGQFGSTKIKLSQYEIPFNEVYIDEDCKNGRRFLVGNISRLCEPVIGFP